MEQELMKSYYIIPLPGTVLFPGVTIHAELTQEDAIKTLRAAAEKNDDVFCPLLLEPDSEHFERKNVSDVGTVGRILQIMRLPEHGGMVRVVIEGRQRARIRGVKRREETNLALVSLINDDLTVPEDNPLFQEPGEALLDAALTFSLRRCFEAYCEHMPQIPGDLVNLAFKTNLPGKLADMIAGNAYLTLEDKLSVLEETNVYRRGELVCGILNRETQLMSLDEKLQEKVNEQMDKNQREYYLREELKAIGEELGETEEEDADRLRKAVEESRMPDGHKQKLFKEIERLRRIPVGSADHSVLMLYIEKCTEIPWGTYTKENGDLSRAVKILERDHYGLKDVKTRITEMLAAMMVSPEMKGQIICLAGPPGVGKTSIAKSIAAATGRKYVRISLGGVRDEASLRGHRRTYVGSVPGRIIGALTDAGSMNPLILLDEVDKLGNDYKGDPSSALLEILDAEQNFAFTDHYIDMPVDLSRVLFLTTANDKYAIPDPLRDRMEIIDLPGYTFEEKFQIAKRHLIPKQLKLHGMNRKNISISDPALKDVINGYTREAGVRQLERKIAALCRKESVRLASGEEEKLVVKPQSLEELLGPRKFRPDEDPQANAVGVVNGLAWTGVGGELLKVEVLVMEGTGKTVLTGSLGDVMKESAQAALSFIRANAGALGIDPEFYKNKDIHIHFPEGAVPKDGPSAGVTMTTALASALTGRAARGDVAMTGEVTLTGRVLPIGGLKEKSMAAYRNKIGTVFIPEKNTPDIPEIDEAVREKITFVPVKTVGEILTRVLLPARPVPVETAPAEKKPQRKKAAPPPEFKKRGGLTEHP